MKLTPHAKTRAKQRYGVDITTHDAKTICRMIRDGELKPVSFLTNTRALYEYEGMNIVYSKSTKRIITFLPKDCYQNKTKGESHESNNSQTT